MKEDGIFGGGGGVRGWGGGEDTSMFSKLDRAVTLYTIDHLDSRCQ